MATREYLKSECGQYFAKELPGETLYYELRDSNGDFLGNSTWWSNLGTNSRIAFEIGVGKHRATFSYARYPSWFKRRWVECFDIELKELAEIAKQCGCEVLVGYKPDCNCWHHLGMRCVGTSIEKFDSALRQRNLLFESRSKAGGWNIECPSEFITPRRFAIPDRS